MKKNTEKFVESLDLETPDPEEQELYSRRITSYSVDALKAAVAVDRIFIGHPAFVRAVKAMDRIFQLAPEMDLPHGGLLVGPTGAGKTAAFRYFRNTLPSSSLFAPGDGAIGLRCPKRPRVGHFVAGLLRAYKYPFALGSAQQLYIRRGLVFDAIKQKGTRLIFVDEAASLLAARRTGSNLDGDTEVSEFLREIVDECKVGLVLAGTDDLDAIAQMDSALASRLTVREALCPFDSDEKWVGVIQSFAKECKSFDIKALASPEVAHLLHRATDGNLRSLKRLMIEAILIAFDTQKVMIDREILTKAFTLVFGSANLQSNVFA
jgi:hypothetical protein